MKYPVNSVMFVWRKEQEVKTETASFTDIQYTVQPRVSRNVGITYIRHKRLGNTDWGIKHTRFQRRLKKQKKQKGAPPSAPPTTDEEKPGDWTNFRYVQQFQQGKRK